MKIRQLTSENGNLKMYDYEQQQRSSKFDYGNGEYVLWHQPINSYNDDLIMERFLNFTLGVLEIILGLAILCGSWENVAIVGIVFVGIIVLIVLITYLVICIKEKK